MKLNPLLKVKLRIIQHTLREIKKCSKLRMLFIVFFLTALLFLYYDFSHYIFWLLNSIGGAGKVLSAQLFQLFFMSLFFLLIFSNSVSAYSSLFRSHEVEYLLQFPLSYNRLLYVKFLESITLTSWAFLFLIGPFLLAYMRVRGFGMGWLFLAFSYLLAYLILAGIIGIIILFLFIYFFPPRILRPYLFSFFIIALFSLIFYLRHLYLKRELVDSRELTFFFSQLMPYFSIAQNPYLPSSWLSKGLSSFINKNYKEVLFYHFLFLINLLFFAQLLLFYLNPKFYFLLSHTKTSQQARPHKKFWLLIERFLFFLSPETRCFLLKDIKSFCRDPIQWNQALVFFGILAVYFGNLQGLYYHNYSYRWRMFIAFLNVAATTLVMASLAIRFVYPQISLEGKRFWIFGISSLSRWKLIWIKYISSAVAAFLLSLILVAISNYMLKVGREFNLASLFGITFCSFAVMAIIVGLSACFPNFKEDNPSHIIAGFGGTVALVAVILFVLITLFLLSFPFQLYLFGRIAAQDLKKYLFIAISLMAFLSLMVILIFLYFGKRALERTEF